MTKHNSNIFQFNKLATQTAYERLSHSFQNEAIRKSSMSIISAAILSHQIDIGIDFNKPWEELEFDEFYQLEYLFVGKLESKNITMIQDEFIGINIFEEKVFGKLEFCSENILNLTLIINKSCLS